MHPLSARSIGSLPNLFQISVNSPTNATSITNVSSPKSTSRPHPFKKLQMTSPSTPISPGGAGKPGKFLQSVNFAVKKEPQSEIPAGKLQIFDGILGKKNSLPLVQKSGTLPQYFASPVSKSKLKVTEKQGTKTERPKTKALGSQSFQKDKNALVRPVTRVDQASKVREAKSVSQRTLTDIDKPQIGAYDSETLLTPRVPNTERPKVSVKRPVEIKKHFDFSKPKEKLPPNYAIKGIGKINLHLPDPKHNPPTSERSHVNQVEPKENHVEVKHIDIGHHYQINLSVDSLTDTNFKFLDIPKAEEKVEMSETLNVPTAAPTENDVSRTAIRKTSHIMSKELELKYGIKIDYSSSSFSDESEEEKEDTIQQEGLVQGKKLGQHTDKNIQKLFKEGSAVKKEGYLLRNEAPKIYVASLGDNGLEEQKHESQYGGKKAKEADVFSSESKEFFLFNESHTKFKEFSYMYNGEGKKSQHAKQKDNKPRRSTNKQTQEDYKPVVARFNGGSQFIQPKFMKNMGSMCYTELWPKHFSLRMQKILIKEEAHEKMNNSDKYPGSKKESKKDEMQKNTPKNFQMALQQWGSAQELREPSSLTVGKRQSDGSASAREKKL